jgi:predicted phage terminase large subunit-like protein
MILKNDSIITGISAEKPDRFRGPQFHGGLLDELAAWQNPQESFDMIMFTMRLGRLPRIMITTTPKPIPLIRKLVARSTGRKADVVITRASTYDNAENLAPTLRAQLTQYEGTQLGRQEIHGEVLDPEEQGVIKRSWWRMWPKDRNEPVFEMIIVSFDTAFTEATRNKEGKPDPTGCSVWGLFREFGKTDEPGRDGLMLLRSWKDHLGFPDLLRAAPKEMERSYGNYNKPEIRTGWGRPLIETAGNKGGRKPDLLIIEDKGSGISLRQMLEREGIYAYAYNPGRASKLQRLHAVSHMFKNGYVWFKEGPIPGQPRKDDEELITEVCTFSGEGTTEHDDLVDSTTQALRYLIDAHQLSVAAPRHDEDVSIDYDDDIEDDPKERSGPYG